MYNPPRSPTLQPKSPNATHPVGRQTCAPGHLAEHLAPLGTNSLNFGPGPILQHIAWRDHLRRQAPTLGFYSRVHFVAYFLAVYTVLPDSTQTSNLLLFGTLE